MQIKNIVHYLINLIETDDKLQNALQNVLFIENNYCAILYDIGHYFYGIIPLKTDLFSSNISIKDMHYGITIESGLLMGCDVKVKRNLKYDYVIYIRYNELS